MEAPIPRRMSSNGPRWRSSPPVLAEEVGVSSIDFRRRAAEQKEENEERAEDEDAEVVDLWC